MRTRGEGSEFLVILWRGRGPNFWSYCDKVIIECLPITLNCYLGYNAKFRLFMKHFKEIIRVVGYWLYLGIKTNMYRTLCLPVITWNKESVHGTRYYTAKKNVSTTATFWRFVSGFNSDVVKILVVYFGLYESYLHF